MDTKDSQTVDERLREYWLTTVLEDRAESAPPPAELVPEAEEGGK